MMMTLEWGYRHDRQSFLGIVILKRDRVINSILDANRNQSTNQSGLAQIGISTCPSAI
jgi:hypothetical protein